MIGNNLSGLSRGALLAVIGTLLICSDTLGAITIETVPVVNAGNANDPVDGDQSTGGIQNFGSVDYAYNIGKYEVTVGQYTAFLNAVAATDTYDLYNPEMATNLNIAGINRDGAPGSFTYAVIGSPNRPVTYVSWGDAARFANWLHNGQPTGPQDVATTEDGSYTLHGAISNASLGAVWRKPGALWFIPRENEWYKAAYHQPAAQGGDADDYWNYAMRTNSVPYSDQPPGATPDNTRVGNVYKDDDIANGYDNGLAATGAPYSSNQNYLTDVGSYTSSPSFYGTFDQGGNVMEMNETLTGPDVRGWRGGSWYDSVGVAQATSRYDQRPTVEVFQLGFRVGTIAIPEPSSAVIALVASLTACCRRNCWRAIASFSGISSSRTCRSAINPDYQTSRQSPPLLVLN
jgi:formylglycine-generating enzyme required for sulfatase activity